MKSHGNPMWACYLWTRALIGTPDFVLDLIQAGALYSSRHPWWASLTIAFPLLAILGAATSIAVGRLRSGNPMGGSKFALLTLRALVTLFEGLLESAPQLVLQLVVLFAGVHVDDVALFFTDFEESGFTWPWFRGLFHVLSLIFSFASLLVTLIYYNEERWTSARPTRFLSVIGTAIFSILYRVFVCAILFSTAPWISLAVMSALYVVNTVVFKATGATWECLLFSYAHLLSPSGFAKDAGDGFHSQAYRTKRYSYAGGDGTSKPSVFSEVERAKINQESLIKRVRISHSLFTVTSAALLIPYMALLEVYVFSGSHPSSLIDPLKSRAVLYAVPAPLLLLSTLFTYAHYSENRSARDAARHWFAITPHRNRNTAPPAGTSSSPRRRGQSAAVAALDAEASSTLPLRPSAPPFGGESGDDGSSPTPLPSSPLNVNVRLSHINENGHGGASLSRPRTPLLGPTPGNARCKSNGSCVTCELLIEGSKFKSMMSGKEYLFMPKVDCQTSSVVYLVTCRRCKKQYVGKTEQALKQRHYGHRREIELQSTPLGKHFAGECGYANWSMQIIDHVTAAEEGDLLRRREGYWQHELMTLPPWGLNTRDELGGLGHDSKTVSARKK